MGAIFISYRRDDSRHAAGRLVDRLGQTFKRDQLFMDVDAIEPGLDFHKVLNEKVAACTVMLAVIGPQWLDTRDEQGRRRLDNPNDFVRLEIEAALKREVRLIPVLVDGAQMPPEVELPEPLKGLVRRQAVRIAHERFGAEVGQLVQSLLPLVTRPPLQIVEVAKSETSDEPAWLYLVLGSVVGLGLNYILLGFVNHFIPADDALSAVRSFMGQLAYSAVGLIGGFLAVQTARQVRDRKLKLVLGAAVTVASSLFIFFVVGGWLEQNLPDNIAKYSGGFGLGAAALMYWLFWASLKSSKR